MAVQASSNDHDEEVRFAVVLNGGVSLAIWMGGVTLEIHRLTRAERGGKDVYGRVLGLIQAKARADVIAGTSAGGINGAFLALGQVYETADLTSMAKLWGDKGSFADLLRRPIGAPLPSLLRGDDYFLPELRKAFEQVVETVGAGMTDPADRPVDLMLTTTIPEGERRGFCDVLGQPIWEMEYTNRFVFSRAPGELNRPGDGDPGDGDPGDGDQFANPRVHEQLALASRSTASFPGAFEPSFISVRDETSDTLHPNMDGIVDLSVDRYGIDGGVLLNKPMRPALEAIWRKRASTQVRRMLLYVNPDPGSEPQHGQQPRQPIPSLRDTLVASLTRLSIGQSIHEDLQELRDANRRAKDLRRARPELLRAFTTPDEIHVAADSFFDVYRDARVGRAARHIADIVAKAAFGDVGAVTAENGPERLRDLVVKQFREIPLDALPFVPAEIDVNESSLRWSWGIAPLERMAMFARDLLRRSFWLLPARHAMCDHMKQARSTVSDQLDAIKALRDADTAFWVARAKELATAKGATLTAEEVGRWVTTSITVYKEFLGIKRRGDHWRIAVALAGQLSVVAQVVALGPDKLAHVSERQREYDLLAGTVRALGIKPPAEQDGQYVNTLIGHLLDFEVCQLPISGDSELDRELTADLVLISADTPNWFAKTSKVPGEKVAGLQLHHFGAFYKESWRVNDWIWGRMDAVTRLLTALLDVDRLRQLGLDGATIRRTLAGPGLATATDEQVEAALDAAVPEELLRLVDAELDRFDAEGDEDGDKRTLVRLESTAKAFANQLHEEIAAEEVGRLAAAVRMDKDSRANAYANGVRFLNQYDQLDAGQRRDKRALLGLFDGAHVGSERLDDEAGTDLFARTASTATADLVGATDAETSGFGRARAVTRPIRGMTIALYALVGSMTQPGRFGRALAMLALAIGGALVAVSLLGDAPGWVTTFGAILVLAGLFAAALRSSVWVLGLLLGPPLLFLVIYLFARPGDIGRIELVLVVALIVIGVSLLGVVREPTRLPSRVHFRTVAGALWPGPVLVVLGLALLWALFVWAHSGRTGAGFGQIVAFLLGPDAGTVQDARNGLVGGGLTPGHVAWTVVVLAVAVVVVGVAFALARRRAAARAEPLVASPEVSAAMRDRAITAAWAPWWGLGFGLVAVLAYGEALVFGKVAAWQPALALTALIFWALTTFLAPAVLLRKKENPAGAATGPGVSASI